MQIHKDAQFIRAVWIELSRWIQNEAAYSPPELIDFAKDLNRFIPGNVQAINDETSPQVLAQSDQQTSLFSALQEKSAVAKGDTHSFFRPENNTGGDTPARFVGTSLGRCRAL